MKLSVTKVVLILFTVVPLVFMGVGTYMARSQHHKITTYHPVQAAVLSTRVEVHTSRDSEGRTSRSYKPVIEYRYEVNGQSYTSDEVTPLDESAGSKWAHEIINRYKAGQTYEAYYNPDHPSEAFLVRQYSFFPYMFILFPMLFLATGSGIMIGMGASQRRPPEPVARPGGRFEIKPTSRIADRRRAALIAAVAWHGVGVLACGHYFAAAEPPYGALPIIIAVIYEAIGCVPLALACHYYVLGRRMSDARLLVGAQRFACGNQIAVHAEQEAYVPLLIEELTVGLVCRETTREKRGSKTTISTHTCYENQVSALKDRQAQPGQTVAIGQALWIPADGQPSSPPTNKDYPRYAWAIELAARIPGSPDYRARFPITVEKAPNEAE